MACVRADGRAGGPSLCAHANVGAFAQVLASIESDSNLLERVPRARTSKQIDAALQDTGMRRAMLAVLAQKQQHCCRRESFEQINHTSRAILYASALSPHFHNVCFTRIRVASARALLAQWVTRQQAAGGTRCKRIHFADIFIRVSAGRADFSFRFRVINHHSSARRQR